jgi:hypothetical protein
MSYDPISGGSLDWESSMLRLAAQLTGIPVATLVRKYMTFANTGEGYSTAVQAGTGAQTANANDGGSVQITTGATANSDEILFHGGFTVSNPKTKRWFIAARVKIETANDAAAIMDVVAMYAGTADNVALHVTNGQLVLTPKAGGTPTDVVTSWTIDTVSKHDFVISFDGTIIRAFVDGVEVGNTTVLTNVPTGAAEWAARVRNGATAAARTITVYDGIMVLDAA